MIKLTANLPAIYPQKEGKLMANQELHSGKRLFKSNRFTAEQDPERSGVP